MIEFINKYEQNMTKDVFNQYHQAKGVYVLKNEEFNK